MQASIHQLFTTLAATCALLGCEQAEPQAPLLNAAATAQTQSAPKASAPLVFEFEKAPSTYQRMELHGPGSETILAPSGATITANERLVTIAAGTAFAVTVGQNGTSLEDFKATLRGVPVVFEQPDLVVYGDKGVFNFRVALSLTPEWDETDTRRLYCYGGNSVAAVPAPTLTRDEVQQCVSACRSLELPGLE